MCGKKMIRDWHRKKIINFAYVAAILILLLAIVNSASAAYGHRPHVQPTPPTLAPKAGY